MGYMTPPASILVIVTRRIGDVLLTTPLIRSVKRAWPGAAVDVLVFAGTEGVLAANPDIRRVLTVAERPSAWDHVKLMAAIARRYDIALSIVPSDRPTLYAWLAGRWRAGLVVDAPKHRWKQYLLHRWVAFDNRDTHTVLMHLALAGVLDIAPSYDVVAAWQESDRGELSRALPFALNTPYAVLHMYPKFNYKMWHRGGWIETARWLQARQLRVVLSGGFEAAEIAYVAEIAREIPGAINLAGTLPLSQAACLIAGARAYVGPDTAVTHMAAALGIPVVALYGATDPVKWGPWPAGYARAVNPWRRLGTQRVNNVILVQGDAACAPCFNEGCARTVTSFSDCLQRLSAATVIGALAALINGAGARTATHG
jgi:heptosyltransferase-3